MRVRNQSTRLVLQKVVTGPYGETAREFAFTLTLRDAQGAPLAGDFGGLRFAADGTAHAALADGGEVTLRGLPAGAVCTIEEAPAAGYETTVQVDGGDAQPGPAVTVTPPPGLTAVVFTNHSDCPPASPTPEPSPSPPASPSPTPEPSPSAAPAPSPTPGRPAAPAKPPARERPRRAVPGRPHRPGHAGPGRAPAPHRRRRAAHTVGRGRPGRAGRAAVVGAPPGLSANQSAKSGPPLPGAAR